MQKIPSKTMLAPFRALVGSVPWALLIVAVFESMHMPLTLYAKDPLNSLRVPALQLAGAWQYLWPLVLLLGVVAVAALVASRGGMGRRIGLGVAGLAVGTACGYSYHILVGYERFAGYVPFIAFHIAVFLFLLWWVLTLFDWDRLLRNRYLAAVSRIGVPVIAATGFVGLSVANYMIYDDAYPTLHMSTLSTSFLFLNAGLVGFARLGGRFPAMLLGRWPLTVALFVATLTSVPVARSALVNPSLSGYLRFSVMGRYTAQQTDDAVDPAFGDFKVPPDPGGVERFKKMSNLPALPKTFNLADYNILQISIEATRFRETSFGNKALDLTPHLVQFKERGAFLFERAYSGSSYTVQSFSSLFRMIYPSASGVRLRDPRWDGHLDESLPTVPGYLSDLGYDTFWRPYSGHNGFRWLLGGFMARFADVEDHNEDVDVLASAKKALTKRAKSGDRFFGWVFFHSPHHPYETHFDDMPKTTLKDRYRQELRYVDGIIGQLIDHVEKEGLLDKTIIIIHGDHGEELKEHGKIGHHSIYSESIHIPVLVRIPGIDGVTVDKPTSLIYLYPWLFLNGPDALRTVAEERLVNDIGPVMKATDGAVVVEVFGHYGSRSALVYDDYTMLYDFASKYYEMYDNRTDPEQKKDIFDSAGQAAETIEARFEDYLKIHFAKRNVTFESGNAAQPETEAHRLAVEALGKRLPKAPVSEVIAALGHEDWRVRRDAAKAVGDRKITDRKALGTMVPMLADENKWVRKASYKAFYDIGVPAAPMLLDALRADSPLKDLSFRPDIGQKKRPLSLEIKLVLRTGGEAVVPVLLKALSSDDARLKRNVSGVLGILGPQAKTAVPKLLELAQSDDASTRFNVISDLTRIEPLNEKVVEAVNRALEDPSAKVRKSAESSKKRIEAARKRAANASDG